jgi:hypothetical protein
MNATATTISRPLSVRVKEPSTGLFYWVVTALADREHDVDLKVDASDHPYPTHEAAFQAGHACMKAIKSSPLFAR